jgi:hypothetical protein
MEADARCQNISRFTGPIRVSNRAELEPLRGCPTISGDLTLEGFDVPDLSALEALEQVRGALRISVGRSLSGLESLSSVGGLIIDGTLAPTLEPLSGLSVVGGEAASARLVVVARNPELRDLGGLSVVRASSVEVVDNPQLATLRGVRLPRVLTSFTVSESPRLRAIETELGLEAVTDLLRIENTGLQSVFGLSGLTQAARVVLSGNPSLVDVSGLSGLRALSLLRVENTGLRNFDALSSLIAVETLIVASNAELEHVDSLAALVAGPDELSVTDNAALLRLPSFNVARTQQVAIVRNASLRSGPELGNLIDGGRIEFSENPQLSSLVGLPALQQAVTLEIRQNGSLVQVAFPSLRETSSLRIVCNEQLPSAQLEPLLDVDARRVDLSGNLGSAQPCLLPVDSL